LIDSFPIFGRSFGFVSYHSIPFVNSKKKKPNTHQLQIKKKTQKEKEKSTKEKKSKNVTREELEISKE